MPPNVGSSRAIVFDHLFRVGLGELDVEHVDAGELLEQARLAFHHRLAGERADVAEAEHGGAVGDDGDEIAARRKRARLGRIGGDRVAGGGDAGRIGEREIALVDERLRRASPRSCRGSAGGGIPARRCAVARPSRSSSGSSWAGTGSILPTPCGALRSRPPPARRTRRIPRDPRCIGTRASAPDTDGAGGRPPSADPRHQSDQQSERPRRVDRDDRDRRGADHAADAARRVCRCRVARASGAVTRWPC